MKNKLLPLLVLFACIMFSFGCMRKMQVISLQCDTIPKHDTLWLAKDQNVEIGFYFYARNGSTVIYFHNPGNKPVFFDKKNSFIAINGEQTGFWNDVSQVEGNISLYKTQKKEFNATIIKSNRVDMIAPKATFTFDPGITLHNELFDLHKLPAKTYTVQANWTNRPKQTQIKSVDFTRENSPCNFRIYITASATEDLKEPTYYDFTFWTSNIMEMNARHCVKSILPYDHLYGIFKVNDKTINGEYHPYKRSWRYFIANINR